MKRSRTIALVGLLAVLVTACSSDDTASATATANRYLEALAGAEDHGWSLLSGSRGGVTEEAYLLSLAELDWDGFAYEAVDAHCDDGACSVWYRVRGGPFVRPGRSLGAALFDEKPSGANAVIQVSQRTFDRGVVLQQNALGGP